MVQCTCWMRCMPCRLTQTACVGVRKEVVQGQCCPSHPLAPMQCAHAHTVPLNALHLSSSLSQRVCDGVSRSALFCL